MIEQYLINTAVLIATLALLGLTFRLALWADASATLHAADDDDRDPPFVELGW